VPFFSPTTSSSSSISGPDTGSESSPSDNSTISFYTTGI